MDDSNTKYLHASATFHRKMNGIPSLCSMGGEVVDNQEGLYDLARDYFHEGLCDYVIPKYFPRCAFLYWS